MELSEEKKKAIETLKEVASDDFDTLGDDISPKMAQNILNVIDKQKKEIKKEKSRIMELAELLDKQENEINSLQQELEIQKGCSISKYKIREKIKNIEDIYKKEMKPYQTEYGLNVSLLSKKEKEELINKRNGLLTQKITLKELLEEN